MVMVLEVAGLPVLQARPEVMTTYTRSPFAGMQEYVSPVPTGSEFLNHWYAGIPPLTGSGVKVTDVPSQMSFVDGEIETLTGSRGFTVMVIVFVGSEPPQVPDAFCNCL
jgi:hypothetical protein